MMGLYISMIKKAIKDLEKTSSDDWIPLEVKYKGKLHEVKQMFQETQQDSESGMEVSCFV